MESSTRFRRTDADKPHGELVHTLTGKKELEEAGPPKPEQAIDSVQRDIETVQARARS